MEGRVEVCYSGVWGTVCNDLFGRADATVACRQLGFSSSGLQNKNNLLNSFFSCIFTGATAVTSSSTFGQGSGPFFFNSFRCTGLEYRLVECVHSGLGVHSCSHSQDVGVRCIAGKYRIQGVFTHIPI